MADGEIIRAGYTETRHCQKVDYCVKIADFLQRLRYGERRASRHGEKEIVSFDMCGRRIILQIAVRHGPRDGENQVVTIDMVNRSPRVEAFGEADDLTFSVILECARPDGSVTRLAERDRVALGHNKSAVIHSVNVRDCAQICVADHLDLRFHIEVFDYRAEDWREPTAQGEDVVTSNGNGGGNHAVEGEEFDSIWTGIVGDGTNESNNPE
jgi:hypothetical protein